MNYLNISELGLKLASIKTIPHSYGTGKESNKHVAIWLHILYIRGSHELNTWCENCHIVPDVRMVSVAECFVKRSEQSYRSTLAIDHPYVRDECIETRLNRPDCFTKEICDRDDPYVKDDYMMETKLETILTCTSRDDYMAVP